MLTTNKILTDMESLFIEYEEKIDLLRWIDKEILEGELEIEDIFDKCCVNLRRLTNVEKVGIFAATYSRLVPYCKLESGNIPSFTMEPNTLQTIIREETCFIEKASSNKSYYTLFVPAKAIPGMDLIVVFQDSMPIAGASHLTDEHMQEYLKSVARQLGIVARTKTEEKTAKAKEEIINMFFENELQPRRCWESMIEGIASFFPKTGPFTISPMPLIQVLSYKKGSCYLSLRATQGTYFHSEDENERHAVGETLPLKVDETICGILIEQNTNTLLVNPKIEYTNRFKAYMYGKNIPGSELIVGIRYKGELIALLNLEHMDQDVFDAYHIRLLSNVAEFLAPFVNALISREDRLRSKEIGLLYVITKLIRRMASTYRHKVDNLLLKSTATINNLRKDVETLGKTPNDRIEALANFLEELRQGSKTFLRDVPDYVNHLGIDLHATINDAVSEFDPEKSKEQSRIEYRVEMPSQRLTVYASRILREHLYNIINNSREAINEAISKGLIKDGLIKITASRIQLSDALQNDTSSARVTVTISDNGVGVPEDIYSDIPQFGFSTKKESGGSGFGLAAAQEYAQFVGGGLDTENRPGSGFIVRIHLQEYSSEYHDHLNEQKAIKGERDVT